MIKNKHNYFQILVFCLYMFIYMTTLATLNTKAAGIIDNNVQIILYYVDSFMVVIGFFFYHLYNQLVKNNKLPLIPCIIFVTLMIMIMVINDGNLFMIVEPLLSLFNGLLGGYIYFYMALSLKNNPHMAMIMAIGNSIAMIIQYLIQFVLNTETTIILIIDIVIVLLFIYFRNNFVLDEEIDKNKTEKIKPLYPLIPCLIVLALTFLNTYFDSVLEIVMVSSDFVEMNAYTWPRLISCLGFILFGYVHDKYNGKYDGVIVLAGALISIINPLIIYTKTFLTLGMCLFYISMAIEIAYMNIAFWKVAVNTSEPSLYSGMGRIIDGTTMVVLALLNISKINLIVIVGIDIVVIMFIFILMFKDMFVIEEKEIDFNLQIIKDKYNLTDREIEVFELLVNSDDGVQEIADKLYISRRTLQRHISSIYHKFDVDSRTGLIRKFYHNS